MSALCHDCPHRGNGPSEALACGGRFADEPHPCHNNPVVPCKGHLRDLQGVVDGSREYNEDFLNSTYRLLVIHNGIAARKEIVFKNEVNHEDIRELRKLANLKG